MRKIRDKVVLTLHHTGRELMFSLSGDCFGPFSKSTCMHKFLTYLINLKPLSLFPGEKTTPTTGKHAYMHLPFHTNRECTYFVASLKFPSECSERFNEMTVRRCLDDGHVKRPFLSKDTQLY